MISNTHINGSMTIGRHINAGGNLSASGSARIGRDLRVDGWLDAPNVKRDSKGLFLSADALADTYPWPEPGWWALVGDTLPADLYVCSDGQWTPTGSKSGSLTVDTPSLSALAAEIADQTAQCREATVAARLATESMSQAVASAADTAEEALEAADDAMLASRGTAILPFDGVMPSKPGSRPARGVWYAPPAGDSPARFVYVSSDFGYTIGDYTDADATPGSTDIRPDALFRLENTLWRSDGHQLVRLADAPVELKSADEIDELAGKHTLQPGRLYCVADPTTRRVTDLYLGA